VEAATSDWLLLLDARVRLHRDSLRFLAECLTPDSSVWNGHVVPQIHGNPFGAFGNVLVRIAWARYFDDPRPTSYGLDDFDHFPKGTGCFLAPRELLLQSMDAFVPRVSDWRLVSDDTRIARVEKITGVPQRERVPDDVVRDADQVEMVDMTPEALRRRMAHGNIYGPDKVDAALANYFRIGNLTALRELALLWLADKVDDQLEAYRSAHSISHTWEARERVVVSLTGGPEGETLIRRGAPTPGRAPARRGRRSRSPRAASRAAS